MPYKHVIKVSEEVYRRLLELTREYNLESPNQLLKKFLFDEPSETHIIKRGSHKIPIYKTLTMGGEVAYVITVDRTPIILTYNALKALCKSGLMDITLCSKTILGG